MFREGLRQGSVLSPLLFLFAIDTLRCHLPPADDMALWEEVALTQLVEGVEAVFRWGQEHKIRLNLSKCEVSFFSSDPRKSLWQPSCRIDGAVLRFNPNPVFLGVTYDNMLTFGPQA